MSTNIMPSASAARGLGTGTWHLDPPRSSVEFHVRLFYGLMTVKGRFERYQGSLDLAGRPAVELTVDADSVNTEIKKRDEHLRTDDFFDVANHPHVRFVSDSATHQGDTLKVCRGLRPEQERPTQFGTWPNTNLFLVTWKRQK